MKKSIMFLLIVSITFSIFLLSPTEKEVRNGETIDLGEIGPGQTITLYIAPEVVTGGRYGQGGRYDFAKVISITPGWKHEDSKLLGYPLQVRITAAKDAKEGDYYSNITVIDENYGEMLDNVTLITKVRIVYDVMDLTVSPMEQTVRPKEQANTSITIHNKGTTGDVFRIWTEGSERWDYNKEIYVAANSTETVVYTIQEEEEEKYIIKIKVQSLASDIINDERIVNVRFKSDLIADYKSTNNGLIIFSLFEGLIYSITGFISNLF